jgi:hypothetical protein
MLFFEGRGAAELSCRKTDAAAAGNPFATEHAFATKHAITTPPHTPAAD